MSIRKSSVKSALNARLSQARLESSKGISTAAVSFGTVVASGGTQSNLSINGTNYRVHTFATTDNFVVTTGGNVDLLMVGGGGASRGWNTTIVSGSGGGGGGGVLLYGDYEQSRAGGSPIVLAPGTTYIATIGAGGAGTANSYSGAASGGGSNGANTTFVGGSISLIAYGGEMGATLLGSSGSNGGNSAQSNLTQCFIGGFGFGTATSVAYQGGGGGGAGGLGRTTFNSPASFRYQGDGGSGIISAITGTKVGYGGGGNGGWYNWGSVVPAGPAPLIQGIPHDGGGIAGLDQFAANAATAGNVNSGGGGGGGTVKSTTVATRSNCGGGGSGIIVLRYIV